MTQHIQTYKSVIPEGKWRVKLFRRWPFDRLRVRWYFEAVVPAFNEEITLEPPPIVINSGDHIWVTNGPSFPDILK